MKIEKLDIQRFSGGSYGYGFQTIKQYVGKMGDIELNDLIEDLVVVLHDVEWTEDCDIDYDDYVKTVANFKKKWFKESRNVRLRKYVDTEVEKLRKELYDTIEIKESKDE